MHGTVQFPFSIYIDQNPNQGINDAIYSEQAFSFQLLKPT